VFVGHEGHNVFADLASHLPHLLLVEPGNQQLDRLVALLASGQVCETIQTAFDERVLQHLKGDLLYHFVDKFAARECSAEFQHLVVDELQKNQGVWGLHGFVEHKGFAEHVLRLELLHIVVGLENVLEEQADLVGGADAGLEGDLGQQLVAKLDDVGELDLLEHLAQHDEALVVLDHVHEAAAQSLDQLDADHVHVLVEQLDHQLVHRLVRAHPHQVLQNGFEQNFRVHRVHLLLDEVLYLETLHLVRLALA